MIGPEDPIAAGVQAWLTQCGAIDCHVVHYALVVGFQRICEDGSLATGSSFFVPANQASYVTEGLLVKASELAEASYEETE